MRSLRSALLGLLLATLSCVMLIAGAISYHTGVQEAGEIFDARLVQSTRVLVSLINEPLSDLSTHSNEPVVLHGWHGQAHGVGEALAFPDGHAYENKLAFQVWDGSGRLLLRSDSAPSVPLAKWHPGYATVVIDSNRWRVFTLRTANGRWFQSAERDDIRDELAEDIAEGTLLPLLLALPVMALMIAWSVNWATRSLMDISKQIGERDPERMMPLKIDDVPCEVHGLVLAVNGLLDRLHHALKRERDFVADAAHALRTPISALKVHAQNAADAVTLADRQHCQQLLSDSVSRVERLVAQLLALSRAENEGGWAPQRLFRLDALVASEVESLEALAACKGQQIQMTLAPESAMGNETAVAMLVRNLLENAMKYTPPQGCIHVGLANTNGSGACLTVEDSGPGIGPEERDRVFDRFYRIIGSNVEGSGLGLSIVREVAQRHGARIALGASKTLGGLLVQVQFASPNRPVLPGESRI